MFDAATTARGRLKSMAKDLVDRYYSKVLDVESFHGNQLEYYSIIKSQVEDILADGTFLEGGVDADVFQSSYREHKPQFDTFTVGSDQ